MFEIRGRSGAKNAKPLCFGTMNHAKVRPDHVRATGSVDKPIWAQVNDLRARGQIQNQSIVLVSGLIGSSLVTM